MPNQSAVPSTIDFGREICGDLAAAEAREWLVTNGIGGFACGTLAGTLTRRYHGLLVAALQPPLGRTLLVSKIDEVVQYNGETYSLGANRWAGGVVAPKGYVFIERFHREGTTPVWTFAAADALLEKRIWMEHGANTTYVEYRVTRASAALRFLAKVLVNYRDYHCLARANPGLMNVERVEGGGVLIQGADSSTPFYVHSDEAKAEVASVWYRNFELASERSRGLDYEEDHLHAATFECELSAGSSITLVASTDAKATADGRLAFMRKGTREIALARSCAQANANWLDWPGWLKQLTLAADQFVVSRLLNQPDAPAVVAAASVPPRSGATLIAGYPWFGDWGRDTMIALPGLLLVTGRQDIAADVLRTYARYVDRGMLPNRFPDAAEAPEYNSVDAALWFFEAVRQYHAVAGNLSLIRELFPVLNEIISEYTRGTRHGVHVDPRDGLLYAGETGSQLTWMDAKVDGVPVTARMGKPIEVNALWLNALATQIKFAQLIGSPADAWNGLLAQGREGFKRFWNASARCCYDVLDAPGGDDPSMRPNQILAVALQEDLLSPDQQRLVVDACARELLTSFGLRSLSPHDSKYRGQYGGDQRQRDGAYHQGTVWGWLIGPFVSAVLKITRDPQRAAAYLAPFENHLKIHGLGTASEIFEGNPAFTPQGCFAQAWTVAEVLRAWAAISNWDKKVKPAPAGTAKPQSSSSGKAGK